MSREMIGLLLGFVGVAVFAGTLPFTRLANEGLDPWFVALGRAALSGVVAIPVLGFAGRRRPLGSEWVELVVVSVTVAIAFPLLTGLALRTVDASHGGVVLGILPLATAAAGCLLTKERPAPAFWASAIAGTALVVGFALRGGGGRLAPGDVLLGGAVCASALGYSLSGRLTQRGFRGWEVISWALVLALPATLPAALWLLPAAPASVPAWSWIGFGYVALASQYLGFFAWNAGLALGGIARVSQVQLLQTFLTLAIAWLINGERPDGLTWLVAAAIVLLVLVGRRTRIGNAR